MMSKTVEEVKYNYNDNDHDHEFFRVLRALVVKIIVFRAWRKSEYSWRVGNNKNSLLRLARKSIIVTRKRRNIPLQVGIAPRRDLGRPTTETHFPPWCTFVTRVNLNCIFF